MDSNGDGKISFVEFAEAFKYVDDLSLSKDQLYDLMKSIDKDGNHYIDFLEFVSYFKPHFNSVLKEKEEDSVWLGKVSGKFFVLAVALTMSELLKEENKSLKQAFNKFDENGDKGLSYEEFGKMLSSLGVDIGEKTVERLAKFVDSNHSGNISLHEFKEAFSNVEFTGKDRELRSIVDRISGIGRCKLAHS